MCGKLVITLLILFQTKILRAKLFERKTLIIYKKINKTIFKVSYFKY